jgi:hypothetical protein
VSAAGAASMQRMQERVAKLEAQLEHRNAEARL